MTTINQMIAEIERICDPFASMTSAELNDWYEAEVGYRPQIDDPTLSDDDLRMFCREMAAINNEVAKVLGQ